MLITGRPNAQKRDHAIQLLREAGLTLRELQEATGNAPALWWHLIDKIDAALVDPSPGYSRDPLRPSRRKPYRRVIQTACKHCGLDIEGHAPYYKGQWRDRGNNTHCPSQNPNQEDGRVHAPETDR